MLTDSVPADSSLGYRRLVRRRIGVLLFSLVALTLLALLSLSIGSYHLPLSVLADTLTGSLDDPTAHHLVWEMRLPRTIGTILAGSGLSLAGVVMQNLLKNPLAAPSTLGVSQGAAFGAALAIILLKAGQTHITGNEIITISSYSTVILAAFAGALLTILVILLLSGICDLSAEAMILAGVAMSALLGACTMFLQYFASDVQVAATLFWTFGDLGKSGWREVLLMTAVLVPSLGYLWSMSWRYNAMLWGDEVAHSLGTTIRPTRLLGLIVTCLLVAVITAFLGIIGFIGLLAPHIMRPAVGNDLRFLIPASALGGSMLLLCADTISRTIMAPVILPVGIITAFAGAPLFLYLLTRRTTR